MSKKEIVNIHKTPDGIWEFETFEKPLRTQIAELKQQLAEKDKEIMDYKDGSIIIQHEQQHKVDAEFMYDQHKEIIRLEQQLAEKDKVLTIYKQALELACFNVDCMYCSNFECRKEPYNEKHNCIECGELGLTQKHLSKYFLDLAKEKLEKGE